MKTILVQLTNKTREIRVLEHARYYDPGELVQFSDDEAVALRAPLHDIWEDLFLEKPGKQCLAEEQVTM